MKFNRLYSLIHNPKLSLVEESLASIASLGKYGDPSLFIKNAAKRGGYEYGPYGDVRIWNEEKGCHEKIEHEKNSVFYVKSKTPLNINTQPILLREGFGKEARYTVWDQMFKPVIRDHVLREAVKADGDIRSLPELVKMFPDEVVPDLVATLCEARGEDVITEASADILSMTGCDLARIDSGKNPDKFGGTETVKYIVVKERNQIKVGDLQVRDEKGDLIPLSNRFNPDSEGIV